MSDTLVVDDFIEYMEQEVGEGPKVRNSYKYHVTCDTMKLMLDYVFADNEDEAHTKAYERLEIPADAEITVTRISDFTGLKWRLN